MIQFQNYTDRFQIIEEGLDVSSDPEEVIGISAVSPPNDALYLQQVTVTLYGIRPRSSVLIMYRMIIFLIRLDLAALSGNESSGNCIISR